MFIFALSSQDSSQFNFGDSAGVIVYLRAFFPLLLTHNFQYLCINAVFLTTEKVKLNLKQQYVTLKVPAALKNET